MMRFWKQKRFWIIIGIGGLLVVGYLWISSNGDFAAPNNGSQSVPPNVLAQDREPPTLVIESPEQGTWMNRNFQVFVFEEDLETAIAMDSCVVQVCAYGPNNEERCTGMIQRACGEKTPVITVGPEGMCSFEGREACFVYVGAQDLAGNKGESQRSYHIDFTPSRIEESALKQEAGVYVVQGRVRDKNIIVRCGLYVNDRYIKDMEFLEDCREDCRVSTIFEPEDLESSTLFIRCSDIAGNTADGTRLLLEVNQAPLVDSCRVIPTKGDARTEFRFSVLAKDPNQDSLSYLWEFGNGGSGNGSETIHFYLTPGTYMPRVTVRDAEGLSAECSTAWVVVVE